MVEEEQAGWAGPETQSRLGCLQALWRHPGAPVPPLLPVPGRPPRRPKRRTTCRALRIATLMLVLNRRLITLQSAASREVSWAVSVESKNATGCLMSRPNSWLLQARRLRGGANSVRCKQCWVQWPADTHSRACAVLPLQQCTSCLLRRRCRRDAATGAGASSPCAPEALQHVGVDK